MERESLSEDKEPVNQNSGRLERCDWRFNQNIKQKHSLPLLTIIIISQDVWAGTWSTMTHKIQRQVGMSRSDFIVFLLCIFPQNYSNFLASFFISLCLWFSKDGRNYTSCAVFKWEPFKCFYFVIAGSETASSNFCRAEGSHCGRQTGLHKLNLHRTGIEREGEW